MIPFSAGGMRQVCAWKSNRPIDKNPFVITWTNMTQTLLLSLWKRILENNIYMINWNALQYCCKYALTEEFQVFPQTSVCVCERPDMPAERRPNLSRKRQECLSLFLSGRNSVFSPPPLISEGWGLKRRVAWDFGWQGWLIHFHLHSIIFSLMSRLFLLQHTFFPTSQSFICPFPLSYSSSHLFFVLRAMTDKQEEVEIEVVQMDIWLSHPIAIA